MRSKDLTRVDQLEMPIARRPARQLVDPAVVEAQPSLLSALNLMMSLSGLEDKELYLALEIDPGHWSRIRRGDAHFPVNKIETAMLLCGSDIPLQWLALRRGYELRPLLSDIEHQLQSERDARVRAEEKLATVIEFMSQTQGRG